MSVSNLQFLWCSSYKCVERKIKTSNQPETTTIRKGVKYRFNECKECIPLSILRSTLEVLDV